MNVKLSKILKLIKLSNRFSLVSVLQRVTGFAHSGHDPLHHLYVWVGPDYYYNYYFNILKLYCH